MPNVYDFMNNFHIIKLYFPFIETSYDLLVQPINYISFQRLFFLKPCEMTFLLLSANHIIYINLNIKAFHWILLVMIFIIVYFCEKNVGKCVISL
jgi:hypothetical protein